jgi:hypothetical protein
MIAEAGPLLLVCSPVRGESLAVGSGLQPHPNRAARLYLLSEASILNFDARTESELKEDWR